MPVVCQSAPLAWPAAAPARLSRSWLGVDRGRECLEGCGGCWVQRVGAEHRRSPSAALLASRRAGAPCTTTTRSTRTPSHPLPSALRACPPLPRLPPSPPPPHLPTPPTLPHPPRFRVDKEAEVLCSKELGSEELAKLRDAVRGLLLLFGWGRSRGWFGAVRGL